MPTQPDPLLTDRERRFVDEYLLDLNQAGAARRAGYGATCSKRQGCRLMGRPRVRAAVERAMAERSLRTRVDQDGVVQALAAVAFCDPRILVDGTGALVPLDRLPDDAAAMLAGVDFVPRGRGGVRAGGPLRGGKARHGGARHGSAREGAAREGAAREGAAPDGAAYVARLRPADRLRALELLGRHLGMFDRGSSGRRAPADGDGRHPGFEVRFVGGDPAAARESPPS